MIQAPPPQTRRNQFCLACGSDRTETPTAGCAHHERAFFRSVSGSVRDAILALRRSRAQAALDAAALREVAIFEARACRGEILVDSPAPSLLPPNVIRGPWSSPVVKARA